MKLNPLLRPLHQKSAEDLPVRGDFDSNDRHPLSESAYPQEDIYTEVFLRTCGLGMENERLGWKVLRQGQKIGFLRQIASKRGASLRDAELTALEGGRLLLELKEATADGGKRALAAERKVAEMEARLVEANLREENLTLKLRDAENAARAAQNALNEGAVGRGVRVEAVERELVALKKAAARELDGLGEEARAGEANRRNLVERVEQLKRKVDIAAEVEAQLRAALSRVELDATRARDELVAARAAGQRELVAAKAATALVEAELADVKRRLETATTIEAKRKAAVRAESTPKSPISLLAAPRDSNFEQQLRAAETRAQRLAEELAETRRIFGSRLEELVARSAEEAAERRAAAAGLRAAESRAGDAAVDAAGLAERLRLAEEAAAAATAGEARAMAATRVAAEGSRVLEAALNEKERERRVLAADLDARLRAATQATASADGRRRSAEAAMRALRETLEAEIERLQTQLASAVRFRTESNTSLNIRISELERQLASSNRRVAESEASAEAHRLGEEALAQRVLAAQAALLEERAGRAEAEKLAETAATQAAAEIAAARRRAEALTAREAALQKRLGAAVAEAEVRAAEAEKSAAASRRLVTEMTPSVSLDLEEAEIAAIRAERDRFIRQADEARVSFEALSAEVKILRGRLDEAAVERREAADALATAEAASLDLRVRLEAAESAASISVGRVEASEAALRLAKAELRDAAAWHSAAVRRLEDEAAAKEAKILSLHAEHQNEIFKLEAETAELRGEAQLAKAQLLAATSRLSASPIISPDAGRAVSVGGGPRRHVPSSAAPVDLAESSRLRRENAEVSHRYEAILDKVKREAAEKLAEADEQRRTLRSRLAEASTALEASRTELARLERLRLTEAAKQPLNQIEPLPSGGETRLAEARASHAAEVEKLIERLAASEEFAAVKLRAAETREAALMAELESVKFIHSQSQAHMKAQSAHPDNSPNLNDPTHQLINPPANQESAELNATTPQNPTPHPNNSSPSTHLELAELSRELRFNERLLSQLSSDFAAGGQLWKSWQAEKDLLIGENFNLKILKEDLESKIEDITEGYNAALMRVVQLSLVCARDKEISM